MTTNDDALRKQRYERQDLYFRAHPELDDATHNRAYSDGFGDGWSAHAATVADAKATDEALMRQALEALEQLTAGDEADDVLIAALRARLGERS